MNRKANVVADVDGLLTGFSTMARIRSFEERVGRNFREGNIHGFVHTSIGQEAIAVGTCGLLKPGDMLTTTHRGHGHCIAKGADPEAMMAELFGRASGTCKGRGGSMHLAQTDLGILGANGIVGAGIPIAVGAALAARAAEEGNIAVAFFGDGAVHTGAFHEAAVLAVAWGAPVVFVCENNQYAEFTPTANAWGGTSPVDRGASYGMPAAEVDGNDLRAVEAIFAERATAARNGSGPSFLEMTTFRVGGHYEGDAQGYRPEGELESRRADDPMERVRASLVDAGRGDDASAAEAAAESEMDEAVDAALKAPYPDPETVMDYV